MSNGWVVLHRELLNKPIFQNEKLLKVWVWCLLKATHKPVKQLVGRKFVELLPGQFITGRTKMSEELNMKPTTAWTYLHLLKHNSSVDIKSDSKYSVVTIENWTFYQSNDGSSDSKRTDNATTNGPMTDTNNNINNIIISSNEDIMSGKPDDAPKKNTEKKLHPQTSEVAKEVIAYLNEKTGKKFSHTKEDTKKCISARLNDKFLVEDFKKVIDIKTNDWLDNEKMCEYLRPTTLFSNKFESYLNQKGGVKNEMEFNFGPKYRS